MVARGVCRRRFPCGWSQFVRMRRCCWSVAWRANDERLVSKRLERKTHSAVSKSGCASSRLAPSPSPSATTSLPAPFSFSPAPHLPQTATLVRAVSPPPPARSNPLSSSIASPSTSPRHHSTSTRLNDGQERVSRLGHALQRQALQSARLCAASLPTALPPPLTSCTRAVLPFKCPSCALPYCQEHWRPTAHPCPSYDPIAADVRAPPPLPLS